MELREYIYALERYYRVIIAGALLFGLVGLAVSFILPTKYLASTTLAVRRQVEEKNPDYFTYEGYYAQQTAGEYADTVVGFLESDTIISQALGSVGMSASQNDINKVAKSLEAKKVAPQLVLLSVSWNEASISAKLAQALVSAVQERSEALNQKGDRSIHIDTLSESPIVEEKKPPVVLNTVVGLLLGLLVSIVTVSTYEYLKED